MHGGQTREKSGQRQATAVYEKTFRILAKKLKDLKKNPQGYEALLGQLCLQKGHKKTSLPYGENFYIRIMDKNLIYTSSKSTGEWSGPLVRSSSTRGPKDVEATLRMIAALKTSVQQMTADLTERCLIHCDTPAISK